MGIGRQIGKYMKKSKISGDVVLMDFSQPTTLGFRTRAAKNLALLRLRSHSPSPSAAQDADSFRYLQLRSRRLEKPQLLVETRKQQKQRRRVCNGETRNPRSKLGLARSDLGRDCGDNEEIAGCDGNCDDTSFGENSLDCESGDRSTRESTPCNLVRDSEAIRTPGSTTRRRSPAETHELGRDGSCRVVPSSREIEEFFEYAEQQRQRLFTEKYNFDIVTGNPLPGRYEWVKVLP